MGAGGNNVPLIMDTMGERTAYAMQSFEGIYKESDKASTIKEWDYKDATDLILEADTKVRRLTPLECGRLQGFPDGWADRTKNQSPNSEEVEFWVDVWKDHWNLVDSKRNIKLPKTEKRVGNWLARELTDAELYKMWGNSLALPCALYVFEGIKAYENILRNNKL